MMNEDKNKEMEEIFKDFQIPTDEDRKAFIDATARKCIADLTEKDKRAFRDDSYPLHYHFGYGMYIRNTYLYAKKTPFALLFPDANTVSGMIIKRMIELINADES